MTVPEIKAPPGHQAEDEGDDLRRGPDCTEAKVDADRPTEEASHQNRAKNGGLRYGVQDSADNDSDPQGSRSAVGEARGRKFRLRGRS